MTTKSELLNRVHKDYFIKRHSAFEDNYRDLQLMFKLLNREMRARTNNMKVGELLKISSLPIKVVYHQGTHYSVSLMTVPELKEYKNSKGYTKALEKEYLRNESLRSC